MLRRHFSRFRLAFAAACILAAPGCAPALGTLIVRAPNHGQDWIAGSPLPSVEELAGVDEQFTVEVGPPEATLSVSIVEPPQAPPRGTILVLHGVWGRSVTMLDTARVLANAQYRAVLVDLRGHGRSSGDWMTYGVQEAADLSQVIDELDRRSLLAGPLGVYGISFGATTAIHLAGRDQRVASVVAVAPFSAMRQEVPHYARTALPGVGTAISDATFQEAVDEAGQRAGFDPDAADAALAIAQARAQVLILHGADDWLVPPGHSERIRTAAPDRTQVVLIPDRGHTTIWFDPGGEVARRSRAWFDRHLADGDDTVAPSA
jgi:pimeloyl-ACP methyl ester carboxylesterase